LSERDKDKDKHERKKGKNKKTKIKQGVWEMYERGNSGVLRERVQEKEKDGKIQMWERGERKQVLDGRRGKEVQNVLWVRETIEHMWNGCSEIREGLGKKREELWMKTGDT
jgi:hypothetical protein